MQLPAPSPSQSNQYEHVMVPVEKQEPWFSDGNIVFSCGGAARFRIHAGVLGHHSEVFRNLFSDAEVQTGSNRSPKVEGCPVIELSETAEDCQNLLHALYGPVSLKTRNVDDFLHLSSVLRTATKYCIDWLRNKAIAYLCRSWPYTLDAWENLTVVGYPIPHPALVINLAYKVDIPIILPLTFYLLGRLPMEEALKANIRSSTGPIDPSSYSLSASDVYNYIKYREQTPVILRTFVQDVLEEFEPDDSCAYFYPADGVCADSFAVIASRVRDEFVDLMDLPPLSFMEAVTEQDEIDTL